MSFDQEFWDARWAEAIAQHGDGLAQRGPNPYVVEVLSDLAPGRALDAGCGHGAESLWLAARGWQVTGVDFAAAALDIARSGAAALELGDRVEWIEADLGSWSPEPRSYDLVLAVYVHADSVEDFVRRLGSGVAPGGTLFMVGHQGIEQNQVSVDDARTALGGWEFGVAEQRPRANGGTDAVILARRP